MQETTNISRNLCFQNREETKKKQRGNNKDFGATDEQNRVQNRVQNLSPHNPLAQDETPQAGIR